MGWLIVSFLIGFAAYWAWQRLHPIVLRRLLMVGAIIFAVAMIPEAARLLLFTPAGVIQDITAQVGDGAFARSLLGFILGVASGYAKDQRIQLTGVWLSLAGAILVLAIIAPHVDDWLSRLAGLKTSVIEIQLTSLSSASKAVQPAQRDQFIRDFNLRSLSRYDEAIENDIKFIEVFEKPDLEQRKKDNPALQEQFERLNVQSEHLARLKGVFEKIVSRAARCFMAAINNGLSIDSARRDLTTLADQLTRLSVLERDEEKLADAKRDQLTSQIKLLDFSIWDSLSKVTERVSPYVPPADRPQCSITPEDNATPFPRHREFGELPHLYVARAFLLLFVNNDRLGMRVLQDAERTEFKDYSTPSLLALLMYYEGDSVTQFYDILDRLRLLALERQDIIKRVNERCGSSCSDEIRSWTPKLRLRARLAEINAINLIAYATAVDVTDRRGEAEPLLPIAEDYAEVLKGTAKDSNLRDDAYLDTAAFVTIVAEAQRAKTSMLNKDKIKDAINLLEKIAAREEAKISRELDERRELKQVEAIDYQTLKTIRAHLVSARGLLD
jgi:hypothetical protein